MKRILVVLLLAALLCGCLPTPEHEIVENKGDRKDWQTEAQPVSDTVGVSAGATVECTDYEQQTSPLYERLDAPTFWSTENNDYGFPIVAKDCPVYLPDVQAVPVLEAEPREITQEDLDAMISVIFPMEGLKWYPRGQITKEECTRLIHSAQEDLANAEPGSSDYKYYEQRLREYEECYSKLYAVAPFASEIQPIEPVLGTYQQGFSVEKDKNPVAHYIHGFSGETTVAGEKWSLEAYVNEEIYGNSIFAKRGTDLWSDDEQPLDAPYGVKMTRAEALKKATELAEKLTGSELAPCYLAPMYFSFNGPVCFHPERRWSQWRVVLMRTFNSFGTAYAKEDIGSGKDSTVTQPVAYENLTIDFDDQGVTAISWKTPMRVTGIVNSDATLLSFEEAANKAMKQIAAFWKPSAKSAAERGEDFTVYLHRVTLGLWRIAKKNGGYYYVPVYHFFADPNEGRWMTTEGLWDEEGTPRSRFLDILSRIESGAYVPEDYFNPLGNACMTFGSEYWGGVTVNALDGTIINKDLGY